MKDPVSRTRHRALWVSAGGKARETMTAEGTPIPGTTLSKLRLPTRWLGTNVFPVDQQIPVWQAYNAPLVEFKPLDDERPGLDASVKIWQKNAILMVNLTCQRSHLQRYSVRFRPSKEEYLILRFGRAGRMVGRIGSEPSDFRPGDIHLFDIRHSFQALSDGVDQISLYLPYDEVGYDPSRDPSHLIFRAESSTNLLIKTAIEVIYDQLPSTPAADASALMTGLSGMLRGILSAGRVPEGSQDAYERLRTQTIQQYILENLTAPGLSAAMLVKKFGASRATIYRAFEQSGGIAKYIQDHRLEQAKWDLLNGNAERGIVRAVAEKYGFQDTANFTRAFRRKFDAAPRDMLATVAAGHAGNAVSAEDLDQISSEILRLSDLLSP